MRVQLSLELLLYTALAGLSFVFVLGTTARGAARIGKGTNEFETAQFVSSINNMLLSGITGTFGAFIPKGLCNSTISGTALLTGGNTFYFIEPVDTLGKTFCPDGVPASLRITHNETGVHLMRV